MSIMTFGLRRAGLLLGIAWILGVRLLMVSPASAAPAPDSSTSTRYASTKYSVGVRPATPGGVQANAVCNITSRSGNPGLSICGTTAVFVYADPPGGQFAYVDI